MFVFITALYQKIIFLKNHMLVSCERNYCINLENILFINKNIHIQ